ncbi:MAG: hypothetical protein AAFX93_17160 [Verrucomicrobiota bacterium]
MATRYPGSGNKPILTAGQMLFSGMNSTLKASRIGDDECALMQNMERTFTGTLRTRDGARQLSVPGDRHIQGMGYYDVFGQESVFGVRNGVVYRTDYDSVYENFYPFGTVAGAPTMDTDSRVEFRQLIAALYAIDGTNLYKYDGTNWSTVVGAPAGVQVIHTDDSRVFLAKTDSEPDAIWVSDTGDGETYTTPQNKTRIGGGDGDEIMAMAPGEGFVVVVLKRNSIYLVNTDPIVDVANWQRQRISFGVGLVAARAWCKAGDDIYFLAEDGVRTVGRVAGQERSGVNLPLSIQVQGIIEKINKAQRHKVSMCYTQNRVLIAVPLENSEEPNYVLVFNTLTQRWAGYWTANPNGSETTWRPRCWINTYIGGVERVLYGQASGDVWHFLDGRNIHQDGSDWIHWQCLSKAFNFAQELNQKQGAFVEFEFRNSMGAVTIYAVLDGDLTNKRQIYSGTTSDGVAALGQSLPLKLGGSSRRIKCPLGHVGRFREIQFLIEGSGTADFVNLREIAAGAWMGALNLT